MKKVWVMYVSIPVFLALAIMVIGVSASTAAAPGLDSAEPGIVRFAVPVDAPDPNETLRLVIEDRVRRNLKPLIADEKLGLVAASRAADMAARQYYAHRNPDGKYYFDNFKAFDVRAGYSCENLDLVFVPSQDMVINEWMGSLNGHRGCMLNTKITSAGYAASTIDLIQFDGSETKAYLIVAVHAELLAGLRNN